MSMCLDLECWTLLQQKAMALRLSQYKGILLKTKSYSHFNPMDSSPDLYLVAPEHSESPLCCLVLWLGSLHWKMFGVDCWFEGGRRTIHYSPSSSSRRFSVVEDILFIPRRFNHAFLNLLSNEMVSNVNVLGPGVLDIIAAESNGTAIVTIQGNLIEDKVIFSLPAVSAMTVSFGYQ
nr:hypothetical protein [Tanacetum cinerariifolium]